LREIGNRINTGYDDELIGLTGHNSVKNQVQNKRGFVSSPACVPVCLCVCACVRGCEWRSSDVNLQKRMDGGGKKNADSGKTPQIDNLAYGTFTSFHVLFLC